jgi:hypothetical protein
MVKYVILLLVSGALIVGTVGCKTSSGSREYIPGKGWVPND